MTNRVLVTGAAGFIGSHLCRTLAMAGLRVVGCDVLDPVDPWLALRKQRVDALLAPYGVPLLKLDLSDLDEVKGLFEFQRFDAVVHLAARPGVRDSMVHPLAYVGPNLVAFSNVLEMCRLHEVGHLLYASSSSVYGARDVAPFRESQRCDEPVSVYAATKRCNELIAQAYHAAWGLTATGLRLFTVYGPWGRPDMACWQFSKAILEGRPLTLYGDGLLLRDFTYIDDVVEAILRLVQIGPPKADGRAPYLNIGHQTPVTVSSFVDHLEHALGETATRRYAELQPGDVPMTCADPSELLRRIGPWKQTSLEVGLAGFASWALGGNGWVTQRPSGSPRAGVGALLEASVSE